jgi:opacity protein-like surface antigen
MGKLRTATIAAAALVVSAGSGFAADIIEPVIYEPPPEVQVSLGGWYLRGDIGMANQYLHGGLENSLFSAPDNFQFLDEGDFSAAPTFRGGIGYKLNDWFRAEGVIEYRGKTDFSALDRYETVDDADPTTWDGANEYSARKSEWLIMANGYIDLGTYGGLTPYVGAGIGASRNTISNFRDINTATGGVAYGDTNHEWNLAWALHAGFGFDITDRLTLDLGYSYLHLGDASSGDIAPFSGPNTVNNPMVFDSIISHDVKFGLRYALN